MAFLCYALLAIAWIVDLFTPQLFIAAILFNGPIALSSLALDRRLTMGLVVAAQVANLVAGYANAIQNHGQLDGIAAGDRILAALSFVLVGSLSIKTQEYARTAGESALRTRQAEGERALRDAVERVRETLNVELVLRGIVRRAVSLFGASRATLVVRSGFETPRVLSYATGDADVTYERKPVETEVATLVERARENGTAHVDEEGALGRMTLGAIGGRHAVAAAVRADDAETVVLVLSSQERSFDTDAADRLRRFAEQAGVALAQAQLFAQLGAQNDEIVRQRDEIARRGNVIRDIVYALSHDLRAPLVAADVTMRQALNGAYGALPDRYADVLRTTLASTEDERRLLETLLLVARYESGEVSTVNEPVDCNVLASRVAQELTPVAEMKGVALDVRTSTRPVQTKGDGSELRRALTNLTANAIAATPAGGHVRIESEANDGHVLLRVQDDGYGVPEDRRAALFERFMTRGSGGGTGLGLYIVRRIAEKHGGSVTYAPVDPTGSDFTVTLASLADEAP